MTTSHNLAEATQNAALLSLVLALADDEFVIGFANSEWTGVAPLLEEDLAFSSLAQDELGHARVLYELAAERLTAPGQPATADSLAYGRAPGGFCHARLAELARGDWAHAVMRQWLYDSADTVRLSALTSSSHAPLAQAAAAMLREERYHLLHGNTWFKRLAEGGAVARARQAAALRELWPAALALFEPLAAEDVLLANGVLPAPHTVQMQRWLAQLAEPISGYGLPWPFEAVDGNWQPAVVADYGGRAGQHTPAFMALWEQMTSVYRIDPAARW